MSTKPQIELFLENESGTQQVAYPFVESDHVSLSNGMDIDTMIRQDVSMPTVTHEDLSFKVGVGDQNVSSAIVDSSVSEMTIKGQTYQNILPEPSTHVLTNDKEMFKVNEGLDPNVEVVDGVSKSAILSGQTLVNIFPKIKKAEGDKLAIEHSGSNTITATVLVDTEEWFQLKVPFSGLIKTDTDYLIVVNVYENTLNTPFCVGINAYSYGGFGSFMDSSNVVDAKKIGRFVFKRKSKPIIADLGANGCDLFIQFGRNEAIGNKIKFDIMAIEYQDGMENWDIPYFEGMASVKAPVLKATGKNLLPSLNYISPEDALNLTKGNVQVKNGVIYSLTMNSLVSSTGLYRLGIMAFKNGENITNSNTITFTKGSLVFRDDVYKRYQTAGDISVLTDLIFTVNDDVELYITLVKGTNTDVNSNAIAQLEIGTVATPYEPYKSNILSTPEEVVLRSVENAQDTINLNTGEYVQRIGEVILNGSESWQVLDDNTENTIGFTLRRVLPLRKTGDKYVKVNCDKLPSYKENLWKNDKIGCVAENNINQDLNDTQLQVRVLKSALSTQDTNGFKSWLQTNPLTIQYILETPVVKTLDLSSSGNWEKVVLDGSEDWVYRVNSSLKNTHCFATTVLKSGSLQYGTPCFSDKLSFSVGWSNDGERIWINEYTQLILHLNKDKCGGDVANVEILKQWLSQNPVTVWYQTKTHQDSTQVKQPIFFKDGHIIQSSGADHSLIPTLDYQAKTSNSYVMDLMKTNTKYTMKAKSASGTFTIDGTSYGAGTNGTFTTPTSMTNKLLVMSNKANTEVMILEGDVTSKTIPYFKGIKSAFEGEDKIEVLSTNHNLWTGVDNYTNNGATIILKDENECVFEHHAVNNGIRVKVSDYEYQTITMSYDFEILDGKALNVGGHNRHQTISYYIDGINVGTNYHNGHVTTYEKNRVYHVDHVVHINLPISEGQNNDREHIGIEPNRYSADTPTYCKMRVTNFQITLGNVIQEYEPHKSNSTKIPLLSSLRSLPNGVCDEIILDRENNKAKIIQRVGKVVLDGSENGWMLSKITNNFALFRNNKITSNMKKSDRKNHYLNTFAINATGSETWNVDKTLFSLTSDGHVDVKLPNSIAISTNHFEQWLSKNPIAVVYELGTPIITEVDLEGFPYIYKDGHIFLNGEITPVTEIKYSINQSHMIEASNQDIIRHQKEIDHLYKLIGEYVRVDYKNTLLSLNLELK